MAGMFSSTWRAWLWRRWAFEDFRRYSLLMSTTGQRESMLCLHVTAETTVVVDSLDGPCEQPSKEYCCAEVLRWRQCGNGCRLELGYCDTHGGDERAAREMSAHNLSCHVPAVLLP